MYNGVFTGKGVTLAVRSSCVLKLPVSVLYFFSNMFNIRQTSTSRARPWLFPVLVTWLGVLRTKATELGAKVVAISGPDGVSTKSLTV